MEYCGPAGIPHKEFLSWDPDDQDLALAHLIAKNSVCPRCGTHSEEWMDDEEEGMPAEPPPYSVTTHRCYGCVAVADALETVPPDQRQEIQTRFVAYRDPEE